MKVISKNIKIVENKININYNQNRSKKEGKTMIIKNGRVFQEKTERLRKKDLYIEGKRFVSTKKK